MATASTGSHPRYRARLVACAIAATMPGATAAQPDTRPLVCSITINSADEIQTFRRHLGKAFRFVELTDAQSPQDPDWFGKACRRGLKCDVLVISGHFAGAFYGNRDFALSLETIEEQSCSVESDRCAGVLAHPKEIFLFGCSTLQQPDQPASALPFPALYNALRSNGFDPPTAVRLATTVKTGLYRTFEERMKRVFSGAQTLYGFSNTAPEGPRIAPHLEQYFRAVPDYPGHLRNVSRAPRAVNGPLRAALNGFSFEQATPLPPGAATSDSRNRICQLYDPLTPTSEGLPLVDALLAGDRSIAHYHAIERFARNRPASDGPLMRRRAGTEKVQAEIASVRQRVGDTIPYASIYFANMGRALGWLEPEAHEAEIRKAVLTIINTPTDVVRFMAEQVRDESLLRFPVRIGVTDLPPDFANRPHVLAALGILGIDDRGIVDAMIENLGSPRGAAVANRQALTQLRPDESQIDRILSILAATRDDATQAGIIYLLSKVGCRHPRMTGNLLELASRGYLRPVATEQLASSRQELHQRCL